MMETECLVLPLEVYDLLFQVGGQFVAVVAGALELLHVITAHRLQKVIIQ